MSQLSHVDAEGRAQMVDVSAKPAVARMAVASGRIKLRTSTIDLITGKENPKGDVLAVARVAGIQAAKQTASLIPLCHTLPLSDVKVDIRFVSGFAEVECSAKTTAQTGVEMEALMGVSVALLTIYDMCKAADKEMVISDVKLIEKRKEAPKE
jgi:cyclic pyranopterin phosphate synthase